MNQGRTKYNLSVKSGVDAVGCTHPAEKDYDPYSRNVLRRLRRYIDVTDAPLHWGGVVH